VIGFVIAVGILPTFVYMWLVAPPARAHSTVCKKQAAVRIIIHTMYITCRQVAGDLFVQDSFHLQKCIMRPFLLAEVSPR
jgi:hypothetical protein